MDNTRTQKQITKNCHFVSRFLTKPWELRDRRLHYYDFDRDVFDESPSKTLFAEEEINTQPVEDWLRIRNRNACWERSRSAGAGR